MSVNRMGLGGRNKVKNQSRGDRSDESDEDAIVHGYMDGSPGPLVLWPEFCAANPVEQEPNTLEHGAFRSIQHIQRGRSELWVSGVFNGSKPALELPLRPIVRLQYNRQSWAPVCALDAGAPNATLFVCSNTGSGTFGWDLAPGITLRVGGISAGTRPVLNIVPGTGLSPVTASDTGTQIDLTINADTAVLATVANAVNFSGKKSFNVAAGVAGLSLVPSAPPSSNLAPGDTSVENSTYNFIWRDNASQWRTPYWGVNGSPCP